MRVSKFFVATVLTVLGWSSTAAAQDTRHTATHSNKSTSTPHSADEASSFALAPDWVEDPLWREEFRGIRVWEYPLTAGAFGLAFGMRFLGPVPPATLSGPALFDRPVMNAWVSEDDAVRSRWSSISDNVWIGSMFFRVADSLISPGLIHGEWRTAGRMLMMDLESFGIMSGALWTTQAFVGRTRPIAEGCDDPDTRSGFCDSEKNRSFISGHVATSTTVAALTCTHHLNMPLLGSKWAGAAMCGIAGTLTTLNGVGRIVNEAHYPTDVVLGMAVGVTAGWIIPQSLHYGWGNNAEAPQADAGIRWSVTPTSAAGGGGLAVGARF